MRGIRGINSSPADSSAWPPAFGRPAASSTRRRRCVRWHPRPLHLPAVPSTAASRAELLSWRRSRGGSPCRLPVRGVQLERRLCAPVSGARIALTVLPAEMDPVLASRLQEFGQQHLVTHWESIPEAGEERALLAGQLQVCNTVLHKPWHLYTPLFKILLNPRGCSCIDCCSSS